MGGGSVVGGQVRWGWSCPCWVCCIPLGDGDNWGWWQGPSLCLRCGTAGLPRTFCCPLPILEIDFVEEVGYSLEGFRKGILLYTEDVADFPCAPCPKVINTGGVVPGDIGLESHEVSEVVCKLPLSLA